MKDRKGFTLIELLAVIIILGILMLIAIPSVNTYVNNSKKNAYITTAKKTMDGAAVKLNGDELYVFDKNTTYYIPGSCIKMENSESASPYADWEQRYIVVTYTGDGFDYYWTSTDKAGMGVFLTYRENLDIEDIKTQVGSIPTNVGVGSREKIVIFEEPCEEMPEPIDAGPTIPDKGRYNPEPSTPEPTGGEATGGSLSWSYENFNIKFDEITNGCDEGTEQVICYHASITVKNSSSTETIKKYVASFDVPQGTEIMHDIWDTDKASIYIDGTRLTVDGLNTGATWNYLTPGKSDTFTFQIKYKAGAPFTLRNGTITYTVLSEGHQTGTTMDIDYISGTFQNKLFIELQRVNHWGQAPAIYSDYEVYITNLTNNPITDWTFQIELPPEYSELTPNWPLSTTQDGRVYTVHINEWSTEKTLQPNVRTKIGNGYTIRAVTSDPNVLPNIR